jgi:hypothetical protein
MTGLLPVTVIGCDKPGITAVGAVGVNVTEFVLRRLTTF